MRHTYLALLAVFIPVSLITGCQEFPDPETIEIYPVTEVNIPEQQHRLPVISIVMEPGDLFDDSTGIYVVGKNGITGYCNNALRRNYCQDWERSAMIEYQDSVSGESYTSPAGIKIHGNCSRNFPQKSFALFARKKYGNGKFRFDFFADKQNDAFEALLLRNSGNDNGRSMFRDGLMSALAWEAGNLDYQAWKPVAVYLNGEYWGIYNLREKLNEHYITDNHGIEPDQLDMLKDTDRLVHGSRDGIDEVVAFLQVNDLNEPAAWEWISNRVDILSLINYFIAELYCANTDWPSNNVCYWQSRDGQGKWRWVLYDSDLGFGLNGKGYTRNMFTWLHERYTADGVFIPNTLLIFIELMKTAAFRDAFSAALTEQMETVYHPDNVTAVIDSIQHVLSNEMEYHAERWGMTMQDWYSEIEKMKEFARLRPRYVLEQYNDSESAFNQSSGIKTGK
jgi:hypothetical protein